MNTGTGILRFGFVALMACASSGAGAQSRVPALTQPPRLTPAAAPGAAAPTPADYVIGAEDVLSIVFWRDKDLSGDVVVRPDGKISLPLLNDVQAAGLTPEQLRAALVTAAGEFIEDPNAAVIVKEIKSRRFFVTGQVAKPGPYPLAGPTTVLQAIAIAGGLLEYADAENISIMRVENGRTVSLRFNYKDVIRRKKIQQNVELKPGDTIVIP
ncbi:MAG TPA: polysaccharide biosynthesis/export family protein [Vicinamibacterales bacterium]|nr:polysaccharide biosynthesis/export family protein [Vicinamibacterales bacterium]